MRRFAPALRSGFRGDVGGAAAIEFAFVAPVMILAILSLLEIGVLCLVSGSADMAVAAVSRTIRTGQPDAPASAAEFEAQVCARMGGDLLDCRERLTISVQRVATFAEVPAAAATPPAGQFNRGGPGDIVLVKANLAWPLMTPFLTQGYERSEPYQVIIASQRIFKNEPFQ